MCIRDSYCTDDPILSKKLEDAGACAIMPLAAPIGSGIGIQNKTNITLIKEQSSVPVIVDAGVGTASDATIAMELGCDGVLINTAIAESKNPILMAEAMKHAVISGRKAFKAGEKLAKKIANKEMAYGKGFDTAKPMADMSNRDLQASKKKKKK